MDNFLTIPSRIYGNKGMMAIGNGGNGRGGEKFLSHTHARKLCKSVS